VFGYLGGGKAPFAETDPAASFILAFRALPLVLLVSALSALLFYWRVLPAIVRAISWLLERTMKVGGVVGLSTAANVFVGMVEAPLFVKPYLQKVSRGELFAIMTGGMASIAGTVLFLYASILGKVIPDAVAHLLIASIVSAPAALVISFLMVPPQGEATGGRMELPLGRGEQHGCADARHARWRAAADQHRRDADRFRRARDARQPRARMAAARRPRAVDAARNARLGAGAARVARRSAVERSTGGRNALGTKTVLNELIAYVDLAKMQDLSERTRTLLTYALCGFANFGSLGIMIGGMSTMCPPRRAEIVGLGIKSIVAGTLATCLTAATVGLVL
jgi:CNT family concentrative nucleoside transporter